MNNNEPNHNSDHASLHRAAHIVYLTVIGLVFAALAAVFLFFPRSTFSELEKRDLATFPHPDSLRNDPQKYAQDISAWFSDTEPYRDVFMNMSMSIRDAFRIRIGSDEDVITIKETGPLDTGIDDYGIEDPVAQGNPDEDADAKVARLGIIIVGEGSNVRALMAFRAREDIVRHYINVMNDYRKALPDIQLYSMVIPSSVAYYLPKKAESASRTEKESFDYLKSHLDPAVKYVDIYAHLGAHTKENIFLRTDHHWAPLGAYYAARALAASAGVPFKDLTEYDQHTIRNYVGSMYGYSKDIAIKNAPEDFVYYTPRDTKAKTTFLSYYEDKNTHTLKEHGPYQGEFFRKFGDGSGNAYLTFMGGDCHLVKIETDVPNSRRLLIIKDSFGNPIPSFLFHSFEEIHVVDFRYFTKNMINYARDNKITDMALAFNIFNACSSGTMSRVKNFLTQTPGIGNLKQSKAPTNQPAAPDAQTPAAGPQTPTTATQNPTNTSQTPVTPTQTPTTGSTTPTTGSPTPAGTPKKTEPEPPQNTPPETE